MKMHKIENLSWIELRDMANRLANKAEDVGGARYATMYARISTILSEMDLRDPDRTDDFKEVWWFRE